MKRIAFILPYFGKFPNYFRLFLSSCLDNSDIDFYIFTDQKELVSKNNIKVIYNSFDEFKERIKRNFDFDVCLETPYELCDFKVAYGDIFQDLLQKYDYWGFCDCDLVWGKIRHFLTDDILKYDKIFMRGHCTLFKNNDEINQLYKYKNIYKSRFSVPGATHFDEGLPSITTGINFIFDQNNKSIYDDYVFMDLLVNQYSFINADLCSNKIEICDSKNSVFLRNNEGLYRYSLNGSEIKRKEYLYIHFQKRFMSIKKNINQEQYYIVPNHFIAYKKAVSTKYLKGKNRNRIYLRYLFSRITNKVKGVFK